MIATENSHLNLHKEQSKQRIKVYKIHWLSN